MSNLLERKSERSSIPERLRVERKRLNLSQEEFGQIGGVLRGAQFNYENGKRTPDLEYLSLLSIAGVDSQFILTGIYSANIFNSGTAFDALIPKLKNLDDARLKVVETLVDGLINLKNI